MALARRLTSPCSARACLAAVCRAFSTAVPSAPPIPAAHGLLRTPISAAAASSRSDLPTLPCTPYDVEQGSAAEPLIHPAVTAASGPSVLVPARPDSASGDGEGFAVMAVPKRKVTPSRKGIRNGPKALKAVPVLVKCLSCGVVKLQHQFCCREGDQFRTPALP